MARLSTILQIVSDVSMELGTTQIPVVQAIGSHGSGHRADDGAGAERGG